ncbi:AAA family ATPase [Mesorhizobium sp. M1322]|uniref:AAA family ATPase n=1 Tax=Mesorhizobium sp. M1322 TaxID=2957081 RepID=UPI00333A5E89
MLAALLVLRRRDAVLPANAGGRIHPKENAKRFRSILLADRRSRFRQDHIDRSLAVGRPCHLAAERFRYASHVFITPPWSEIFRQDSERKQTLDEAERTYHALADMSWSCCP